MKTRLITAFLCVLGLGALSACANSDTTSPSPDDSQSQDGEYSSSALNLTSDTLADTDVARMKFQITSDNCQDPSDDGQVDTQTKDLEDMMLPGGIAAFENKPFDEDSKHLFADAFFTVDATCDYDVVTTPLRQNGTASQDCEQAHRENVSIEDGQTNEILLINQCEGAKRGGLDVVSALNYPPQIDNLELDKFQATCPTDGEQVCVRASDPDDDPLEFVWSTTQAGEFEGGIVETSTRQLQDGSYESCARVSLSQKGGYSFRVQVFDLDGNGNRMEEVLAQQDSRDAHQSRDSLQFPVYSGADCRARRATILMAIGDNRSIEGPNSMQRARRFIRQTARWASPVTAPSDAEVLYVLDDRNFGEHLPSDQTTVFNQLTSVFGSIDTMGEPANGLRNSDVRGYDLVWFANPGYPIDDVRTRNVLRRFNRDRGVGVVLEGDDMGRATFGNAALRYFTGLRFLNNGETTCGDTTNNYSGNTYRVQFTNEPVSALNGLRGRVFRYDNDIDHVRRRVQGERVLANARYSSGNCTYRGPAATAIDPIDLSP